jgi:hypothetical protein
MKTSDWDDPTIRAIGRRYAAAYDLASELHNYGADAAALLKSSTRSEAVADRHNASDARRRGDGGLARAAASGLGPRSASRRERHGA